MVSSLYNPVSVSLVALLAGLAAPARAAEEPGDGTGSAEPITVTGRLETTARSEQAIAVNLVNIQAAETIAKYPDVNAAEALGRISGVALSIDTGEGRFVNIRGLDGNLNGATFGGAVLLNTQAGGTYFNSAGRAVEFDTVPVGAIDRIVVTKTGLPDHEAEGIGGSIELTPRSAIGHDRLFFEGSLGSGYEPARKTGILNEEAVIGGGFGDNGHGGKLFHVVLTQFQHNDARGFDDIEEGYADSPGILGNAATEDKVFSALELRRYQYNRRRFGYSAEVDLTPSDAHRIYARFSLAGYHEHVHRQRLEIDGLDGSQGTIAVDPSNRNGFLVTGASAVNTLRDEYETHRNLIAQLGGDHRFGKARFEWLASYVRATYDKPYDINTTLSGPGDGDSPAPGFNATYDNVTNPDFPVLKAAGVNLADPGQYILAKSRSSAEYDKDQEYSYQGKLSLPLGLFADDSLAVGAKLRYREKYALKANSASVAGTGQSLNSFLGAGPYTDYYNGLYNIGYSANGDAIASTFASQLQVHPLGQADTLFRDHEDVVAGFAQYEASLGKLHALAGVRVERTRASYGGFVNGAFQTISNSYTNAFPTVQLRYEFAKDLVARATWSTGLARPGFLQTIQSGSVDFGAQVVTTGNPYLKPTYSNNFDLSLEYYLPNAGIVSIGLFDKELRDYIVARTFRAPYPPSGTNSLFLYQSFANISGAYARGIELAYVNKFAGLPAPFDGIGIDSNFAYVNSSIALHPGQPNQPLPGSFEYTGNAALFYEKNGIELRLAAEYESKSLFGIGGAPTTFSYAAIATDVYQDKRLTLDLAGSYQLFRNVKLYASVKNLTDEPLRFYEGTGNRPIQREFYGQTYEAGIRVSL